MKITLNPNAKDVATRDALVAEGGFGKYYTDHMVMCEWSEKDGWGEPHLMPYGPISLDPATAVFHYGQEIFEGMKAYRQPDGSIALFRPTATVMSVAMMLDHLGFADAARDVERVVAADLLARGDKKRSTSEVGDALASAL